MAMSAFTDMLVDLSDSPGFRRANLPPITPPLALIIVGGLRELTALYVEDGEDVREITEAAVTASTAILGMTGSASGDSGISVRRAGA